MENVTMWVFEHLFINPFYFCTALFSAIVKNFKGFIVTLLFVLWPLIIKLIFGLKWSFVSITYGIEFVSFVVLFVVQICVISYAVSNELD